MLRSCLVAGGGGAGWVCSAWVCSARTGAGAGAGVGVDQRHHRIGGVHDHQHLAVAGERGGDRLGADARVRVGSDAVEIDTDDLISPAQGDEDHPARQHAH